MIISFFKCFVTRWIHTCCEVVGANGGEGSLKEREFTGVGEFFTLYSVGLSCKYCICGEV